MPSEKSHPPIKIVGVIVTYWTVSISMVFANKYLVGDKLSDKLDVSLFVAWAQCVSTVLVVVALVAFRRLVARSMTLIFTVIFSSILLRRVSSLPVVALLPDCGRRLRPRRRSRETWRGTLSHCWRLCTACRPRCFVSLNGIFTKRLLDMISKNQALAVTYYYEHWRLDSYSFPLLICSRTPAYSSRGTRPPLLGLVWGAQLAQFGLGRSNMQIDYTSPSPHHISNNTKAVLPRPLPLAVFVYSEHKSAIWWLSNCLMREESVSDARRGSPAAARTSGANGKSDQLKHLSLLLKNIN
uniref:TPT domain-containing protein n=1 Tax=Macrostomum lignano TaxID=282301 RepID=A0A1I8IU75_9PLAT